MGNLQHLALRRIGASNRNVGKRSFGVKLSTRVIISISIELPSVYTGAVSLSVLILGPQETVNFTAVYNRWTGLVDWTTGLDGCLDSVECVTVEWNSGTVE